MPRTVLLPLDGSSLAELALTYGAVLAHVPDTHVILLSVLPATGYPDADAFQDHAHSRRAAAAYLKEAAAHLAGPDEPARVETVVVDAHGRVAEDILAVGRQRGAELLVMATHGRSGLGRWLYGSVADEVLRHAEVPVLLVPAACPAVWPTMRRPRLLVPLDESELAGTALNAASELAAAVGADLVLLRVVEPPLPTLGRRDRGFAGVQVDPFFDPAAALVAAKQSLERTAETLRGRGHTVTVVAGVGYAAPEIAAVARERHADVIAMATHGRSGVARLVLGSVATGTLQQAVAPLLLVGPDVRAEPAGTAFPADSVWQDAAASLAGRR